MQNRKIDVSDIGCFEIRLARSGAFFLRWITSPRGYCKYEIYSGNNVVYTTDQLRDAVEHYNKLLEGAEHDNGKLV